MEKLITEVIKKEAGLRTLDISFEVSKDIVEPEDDADEDSVSPEETRHMFLSTKGPGTSFWNSHIRPVWPKEEAAKGLQVRETSGTLSLKIVILGDTRVGKSNYFSKISKNDFNPIFEPTIGVNFKTINRTVDETNCKFMTWDTAGQEKFSAMTNSYRAGSNAFIIGYDITSRQSVDVARERFMSLYREYPWAVIMVIGNKADMKENRAVSTKEGEALARDLHASLFFESNTQL